MILENDNNQYLTSSCCIFRPSPSLKHKQIPTDDTVNDQRSDEFSSGSLAGSINSGSSGFGSLPKKRTPLPSGKYQRHLRHINLQLFFDFLRTCHRPNPLRIGPHGDGDDTLRTAGERTTRRHPLPGAAGRVYGYGCDPGTRTQPEFVKHQSNVQSVGL